MEDQTLNERLPLHAHHRLNVEHTTTMENQTLNERLPLHAHHRLNVEHTTTKEDQTLNERLPLHAHHRLNVRTEFSHRPSKYDSRRSNSEADQFLLALNIAGIASFLLVTVFGLFHVDVFLRAYRLPLETFSTGNMIFSVINTSNNFLGAWFLDSVATKRNRSDLIGVSGFLFAIFFLAPFFRWKEPSTHLWDGAHFVLSISLYDTLCSFNSILLGSLVTDNHHMNDKERVWFMASGKIANLTVGLFVVRIGLEVFEEEDLTRFRQFLKVVAAGAALMFCVSQALMRYSFSIHLNPFRFRCERRKEKDDSDDMLTKTTQKLKLKQAVRDLWNHKNFWAWIKMELLLESQVSFVNSFLKTFVDRLIYDAGISRDYSDWLLSAIPPAGLVCGVLIYIPIRTLGYKKVYPMLFGMNVVLCIFMLFAASHESPDLIILFLAVYPAITGAVQSAGFHLVMSDMVLEMKKVHASEQRFDEPSLAGLFMGVNALFCKPAEYLLPVVAALSLGDSEIILEESEHGSDHVRQILFRLLVLPPLVFSVLQWVAWRSYTLTPDKTRQIRDELIRSQKHRPSNFKAER
jgi:Na+/melibiose symporter-like transporter